ncbi:MAG: TetR/AcrR family transcriptional regulator C-terminal domain-containing protein [Deltaproteobacteria bacterium]|nr:TetR/AcrR family transcriptional regulator C-terminal domain-containing protein [Deltaproteobacteria bacterium]
MARVPLSQERVLRAAVEFADEHGIAALSMRKLGQRLGVEAMSLYNHVSNKDAILEGMVEVVMAEVSLPTRDGEWRGAMRARAESLHAMLLRHPWATMVLMASANPGPVMLAHVDATLGLLRHAGFSVPLADHAWNAVDSYIYGYTLQQLSFPFAQEDYAKVAADSLPHIPRDVLPHLVELTESIIAGHHSGVHTLGFGFDLLVDGLERLRVAG